MQTLRILIVDDCEPIRTMLARLLRRHEVTTASCAADALDAVHAGVDLVISDLDMPGINGVEFLVRVAAAQPLATRFLCTGSAPSEALVRDAERVAHRFFYKPLSMFALLAAVREVQPCRPIDSSR